MLRLIAILWIVLELLVFAAVAEFIGVFPAILLVVISTLLGGSLMRWQGIENLRKAQEHYNHGKAPEDTAIHAAAIVMGGIFMVVPGFITSFLGILLLIPFTRSMMAGWVLRRGLMNNRFTAKTNGTKGGRTIEAENWQRK